eukprot:CAMPEP_0168230318 /NCGR_PEP_ID=MMETSP0140_2-20121125/15884_1 /TAXON_ID=44445 /ORGANISM="Pseudo-nitzschia australis, Strain 10249 10 AB" /LENGTH=98 /DNA_ID=CAMNT_0008162467 /DNA_START=242 /DNA_END=534 /DNA_ORIENTATION=-
MNQEQTELVLLEFDIKGETNDGDDDDGSDCPHHARQGTRQQQQQPMDGRRLHPRHGGPRTVPRNPTCTATPWIGTGTGKRLVGAPRRAGSIPFWPSTP